jgi:UDP-glucose 4-epimerase
MGRVLVTGGAGFIGMNLIKRLINDQHKVVSIDDYSVGSHDNEIAGASYIEGSVLDINKLNIPQDIDYCIHLAAFSRIQPTFQTPVETFWNNACGTLAVLEWARQNGAIKKFIYSGSSSRWHNPVISPYATAKDAGERLCKMYRAALGLTNTDIVRFYNVYGPGEITSGEWAAIIGKWRGLITAGKPIEVVGDGTQRRAFTYIDDVVDGIIRVMLSSECHEDGWELGSSHNYAINDIAAMFQERYPKAKIKHIPKRPGEYTETNRENNDAIERLGWQPQENHLREYILSL